MVTPQDPLDAPEWPERKADRIIGPCVAVPGRASEWRCGARKSTQWYLTSTGRLSTRPPISSLRSIIRWKRSEEHTSELQSLMRNSYAVFCLNKQIKSYQIRSS